MRRGLGLLVLALAAWACAVGACSGETSFYLPAVDAGAVSTKNEAACAAWAVAVCNREGTCPGSDPVLWTSEEQCLSRSTLLCEVVSADPNVDFDAQKLLNCTYSADCNVQVRDLPLDCLSPGRSLPGEPCVFNEACTSNVCGTTTSICGACTEPAPRCPCEGGLVCASVAADGGVACGDVKLDGGTCTSQAECPGAYCDLTGIPPASCIPLAGIGEPCGDGVGAAIGRQGTPCGVPNTYCDVTLHCSVIEGVGYADPCGTPPDGGPLLACAGYGICDPSSYTCIQPSPDGEVCDESQGLGCMPPAECIEDRCLYPSLSYCVAP